MGLDMFLYKKTFIGAEYDFEEIHGIVDITRKGEKIPIKFKRISDIVEKVGYWRKANAIHRWFVENCGDGVDECQEIHVSKEKLAELLDNCEKVKADHALASELLPTQSGFFFGGTDYDEYYFDDVTDTIRIVSEVLREGVDDWGVTIYYQASW